MGPAGGDPRPEPASAVLTTRFDEAVLYATLVHGGQLRKGTPIPYLSHLLAVAALVLEDRGDEHEVIAALLHDAVEDRGGRDRLEDIRARFGEQAADIVEGCSDSTLGDGEEKAPWLDRKKAYIHHLKTTKNRSVLLVSAADKLHNARSVLADYLDIGEELWPRFKGGGKGTLWYYREVSAILADRLPGSASTRQLSDTIDRLESAVFEREGWRL